MSEFGDSSSPTSSGSDWPQTFADTIIRTVDQVRSKTTGPAVTVSRLVVYGLLAAVLGVIALVLLVIGLVRFTNAYLPGDVWSAHLLWGVVFGLVGFALWTKRTP